MAIGDIYQMTTYYDNDGQDAQNVFTYVQTTGSDPNDAESLAKGWFETVWLAVREAMNSLCILRHLEAINLMDQTDAYDLTGVDSAGLITVTASSQGATFDAWGVRYTKAYPGAPTGYKRFPGVAETITSRNLYIVAQGDIDAILLELASFVEWSGGSAVFSPVLVKRPYTYAMPPTVWYPVTDCVWTNLTTQSSRKE